MLFESIAPQDITDNCEAVYSVRYEPVCPPSKRDQAKDWRSITHLVRARMKPNKKGQQICQSFGTDVDPDIADEDFIKRLKVEYNKAEGWIHNQMMSL